MSNFISIKKLFYLITFFFIIWIIFFDSMDLITLIKYKRKLKILDQQKFYYLENIRHFTSYQKALESDKKLLEKIAREKYFMKKKGEDIFIIN